MYSEEIISTIANRIGWGKPQVDGFTIDLDEAVQNGTTKRVFHSFHKLVTVENVLAAVPDPNIESDNFNLKLKEFSDNATREILSLIIDQNPKSNSTTDYSGFIQNNAVLFDNAVGYKVAISVLELLIVTERENFSTRSAQLAISSLKLEIEGWKNEAGITVANGLGQKLDKAVTMASDKLFPPQKKTVTFKRFW